MSEVCECVAVETAGMPKVPQKLEERDAMVGIVYSQPRVLVLRHQSSKANTGAEVLIYTVSK